MSLNLAMILREAARTRPDEAAVLFDDRELTYEYPRAVEFREHLPMNATGKILKREL